MFHLWNKARTKNVVARDQNIIVDRWTDQSEGRSSSNTTVDSTTPKETQCHQDSTKDVTTSTVEVEKKPALETTTMDRANEKEKISKTTAETSENNNPGVPTVAVKSSDSGSKIEARPIPTMATTTTTAAAATTFPITFPPAKDLPSAIKTSTGDPKQTQREEKQQGHPPISDATGTIATPSTTIESNLDSATIPSSTISAVSQTPVHSNPEEAVQKTVHNIFTLLGTRK